jgi:hypothetical protein
MKTIKQIADELGVSKDALRKRISREPLKINIEPHIEIKDGAKYINSAGVDIIRNAYLSTTDDPMDVPTTNRTKPRKTSKDNPTDIPTDVLRLIDNMRADHKSELEVKNKQIEELNARLAEVTELANVSQRLHAGTLQQQLTTSEVVADERGTENAAHAKPPVEPTGEMENLQKQIESLKEMSDWQLDQIKRLKKKVGFFGLFRRKS